MSIHLLSLQRNAEKIGAKRLLPREDDRVYSYQRSWARFFDIFGFVYYSQIYGDLAGGYYERHVNTVAI